MNIRAAASGLALTTAVCLSSCANPEKQNQSFLQCSGVDPENSCSILEDHLPMEVSYYIHPEEGIYRFDRVSWNGKVELVNDPNLPLGSAEIYIWKDKGETHYELGVITINKNLPEEQIPIILKKEVWGHAAAISYIANGPHSHLLDPSNDNPYFGPTIAFIDKLSHLTLTPEEFLTISPNANVYIEDILFWDGSSLLSTDILDFIEWWNSVDGNNENDDMNEIIQIFRGDLPAAGD